MSISSPVINNLFKDTIRGNVLDEFDAPKYDIKIYMIGFEDAAQDRYVARSRPAVVLAQTGVTADAQLGDVELECIAGSSDRPTHFTSVRFRVTQPGAVDFLDRIKLGRSYLGWPVVADNSPIFMEIAFRGWSDDESNEPTLIRGPYRYRLEITKVEFNITPDGSTYDFECRVVDASGYNNVNFVVPGNKTTTGRTVREHIEDLKRIIAEHYDAQAANHLLKDQFEFKTDHPSFSEIAGREINYDPEKMDVLARTIDPNAAGLSTEEREELDRGDGSVRGSNTGLFGWLSSGPNFTTRNRLTVQYYIFFLLCMTDGFLKELTRFDRESGIAKNELGYVKKLVIDVHVGYQNEPAKRNGERIEGSPPGWDPARNTMAKVFTYVPKLIDIPGENSVINPEETVPSAEDQLSRLNSMSINKAYYYMYTGLNDQIIDVDISYNNGFSILLAPLGGFVNQSQLSGLTASVQPGTNPDTVISAEDVRQRTEESSAQALTIQSDIERQEILEQLDDDDLSDDRQNELEERLDVLNDVLAGDLTYNEMLVRLRPQTRIDAGGDYTSDTSNNTKLNQPEETTLLAYVYQNNLEESFLISMNLTTRGDPYYLGEENIRSKGPEVLRREFDPNEVEHLQVGVTQPCFLFEMRFPRFHNEETGLWEPGDTSSMISGVYQIMKVTHRFSDGVYTNEIDSRRVTGINLSEVARLVSDQNAERDRAQEQEAERNSQRQLAEQQEAINRQTGSQGAGRVS